MINNRDKNVLSEIVRTIVRDEVKGIRNDTSRTLTKVGLERKEDKQHISNIIETLHKRMPLITSLKVLFQAEHILLFGKDNFTPAEQETMWENAYKWADSVTQTVLEHFIDFDINFKKCTANWGSEQLLDQLDPADDDAINNILKKDLVSRIKNYYGINLLKEYDDMISAKGEKMKPQFEHGQLAVWNNKTKEWVKILEANDDNILEPPSVTTEESKINSTTESK